MVWIAIEDSDTYEVSEFEEVTEEKALYLMAGYRVDKRNPTKIRMQEAENVYEGSDYKGGFGYNLLIASKYVKE